MKTFNSATTCPRRSWLTSTKSAVWHTTSNYPQTGSATTRSGAYPLHLLHDKHAAETSYNQAVAALRFFYEVSSPSGTVVRRLPYGKQSKRLPDVRSVQEVAVFLNALPGRTIPMVLRTIYATGMRISEVLHLTAAQIDSSRMVVRVLGKGRKERLVPLSPRLLEELRV